MTIAEFQGETRFLSNFYGSPQPHTILNGVLWSLTINFNTAEAAYQASKTTSLHWIELIAQAETPGQAKRAGRAAPIRSDWEETKLHVMLQVLRQKFCDPMLARMLLATKDQELIEGNAWGDEFWGVCKGVGENHLGRLLMQVRDEVKERG